MRQETGLEWPGWLLSKGYDISPPGNEPVPELYRPVAPQGRNEPAIDDPALYRAEDSDTAYLTDRFLTHMAARRFRPWFAHLAYIRPHPPLVAPEPYNRLIDPASLPQPDLLAPGHPFIDAWFSEPAQCGLFWGFDGDCAGMAPEMAARARAVYLGLVAEVDYHIGRILDWLDETGLSDDTLVIVTGDHGEMLGDKRMWGKESVFEPAWNVPLIVAHPRLSHLAGTRSRAITESVDLAPTMLEFMGGTIPPAFDGTPLTAIAEGRQPRHAAFMEIDLSSPVSPTRYQRAWGLEQNRCNVAILREERWKYVHFNGGVPPLLFDLANDPLERHDLAGEPAASAEIARLRGEMLDRRMERADRRLTGFSFGV